MTKNSLFGIVAIVAATLGLAQGASAQLVNGGFEAGDLSGWTAAIPPGGFIQVVPAGSGQVAIEGNLFARMKTNGPGSFTTLSQSFSAQSGFEISGYAFFLDQEAAQGQPCFFADRMEVNILAPGNVLVSQVFLARHCLGGFDGSKPWTLWSYAFDGTEPAGPYTVQARITNIGDTIVDSTSGLDGVRLRGGLEKDLTSGPDADGQNGIDLVVEVGQTTPTSYDFTLDYFNIAGPEVLITDTVPAEWQVEQLQGGLIPVNDGFAGPIDDQNGGTGSVTVHPSNNKPNNKSATQIEWTPDTTVNPSLLNVDSTARCHDNRNNQKCRPTSCGALYLNEGPAQVWELDSATGEPLPQPPLFEAGPLCLAAVSDLDGGGLVLDGSGDEDGDGIADLEEACGVGSDPCNPDTDGDGAQDGADADPLDPAVQ